MESVYPREYLSFFLSFSCKTHFARKEMIFSLSLKKKNKKKRKEEMISSKKHAISLI